MNTFRLVTFISALAANATAVRPHIVVVIVDDVGANDVGWKNPLMQTPILDSLRGQSTDLERFYAYPTCSPSRGALFTGRFAHETGLTFALIGRAVGGVDLALPTVAHSFASRGYNTELIGKWHLGDAKEAHAPTARGFDRFFGLKGGAFNHLTKQKKGGFTDLWKGDANGTVLVEDPIILSPEYHATEMFTDAAVASINAQDTDRPMFLALSYSAPHDPLLIDPQRGDEYMQRCSGFDVLRRRQFCAMLAQVDDGIGRVVEALQQQGMWENTALMFLSDNGGMPYGGGNNAPFRGMKSGMFEGAVRVPGFLHLPQTVLSLANSSNSVVAGSFEHPFHITDIAPTLLAVSDAAVVEADASGTDPHFDGRNMLPALMVARENKADDEDTNENSTDPTHKNTHTHTHTQAHAHKQAHERGIVLQHDPYTNGTAFLKGSLKLMVGSPGIPWVFLEPTSDYSVKLDGTETRYVKSPLWLRGTVMEAAADLAESLSEGAGLPFTILGYVVAMNRVVGMDWVSGTHYRNLLVSEERDFPAMSVETRHSCPTLEPGHIFLYDVVQDPTEASNLAQSHPEVVLAMHEELCEMLGRSNGVIVAGDAEDSAVTEEEAISPWLADDTDISTLRSVKSRFFVELAVKMSKLAKIIALFISVAVISLFGLVGACCHRRSSGRCNSRAQRKHEGIYGLGQAQGTSGQQAKCKLL